MKLPLLLFLMTTLATNSSLLGAPRPTHLFLAGDSTMASKEPAPGNPERGWGEALPYFFNPDIVIDNRALNGRSTLSFRTEGHWEHLLGDLQSGDWVLIQFGHNDQKDYDPSRYAEAGSAYRDNLRQFVSEIRSRGAHPILATSIARRNFTPNGRLVYTHGEYPEVVRELAKEENVPLLDLQKRTHTYIEQLGEKASKEFYLWPTAGKYVRFPKGKKDDSHLSLFGATLVAQMATEELVHLGGPLSESIIQPVPDFTTIRWQPLQPKAEGDMEEEVLEDERISNVRNPSLGFFPSTLGNGPRPAVIVCPGGGYARLSIVKEGEEIARWLNSIGIDAYVLKYRMKEFGYPAPLQDVTMAVRYLRKNAQALDLDPAKIGVLGFSAGGHVAGMAATLYDSPDAQPDDDQAPVSSRPDFAILAYPVVTMKDPFAHAGSRRNLLGNDPDPALIEAMSLERQVNGQTPPVFLMHTADDASVPVENSLNFASALSAHDVPCALHVYASAPHGIGMRWDVGPVATWPMALADWLVGQGIIPGQ